MIGDPATAPVREDLVFLRRRSRAPQPPADSALADFIAGRARHPGRTRAGQDRPSEAAASSGPRRSTAPISFERPDRRPARTPEPAQAPEPARPAEPAPAPQPSGLDLSAAPAEPRAQEPARPAPKTSSLDLSGAGVTPASAPPATRRTPPLRVHDDQRVRDSEQQILDVREPTVTLTRVQSGIGQLNIEAICSAEVGDLRLGAAYQLEDASSSTVQYSGGSRFAPSMTRPVIVAGNDEFEYLRVDLRRVNELERMVIYAFSESRTQLDWGGTLVFTSFGGARVELPLETLFAGTVAVLASIYNLDGELVIRAEMETITGDIREAARGYGYDRITWRDDRTPIR